ncbi:membrane protein insertion efficiency factor YidD [candidate division WWE3 bacterium CG10_big_fil_rev_8_21_14_0_10_32_10]|uniref:Putative membrane protein insertion efficiency factor n=1 Tax=candidate division WWE3 bacterium CG10_big_fil_rev_8_21_14_0_10_32_10 TaxID=1975090 RepID=A0A2H0RAD8_UNCKA|nr:MAG: membrane protein insertion efficiency factor YidD [candidate division WWE3 bacterium CG10_big_fil_rev_8_21_14_0_10_32_10]
MKKLILKLIIFYQRFLSLDQGFLGNLFGNPKVCIYNPTCSVYTYEAIKKYGIFKGVFLGIKRILRCTPFNKGGYDPLN